MKKKIGIIFGMVAVVAVAVIYYVYQNQSSPSVGINSDIVDADQKVGSSTIDDDKVLVVYFSNGGNTQKLAKEISDQVGGDFRRIEPSVPYPQGDAIYDYTKLEQEQDERPAFQDMDLDMSQYDTIFIGYPIWWYTYPQIILSFFDAYDMNNKTIVPFVTHGGSNMSGTVEDMRNYLSDKNVTVLEGLAISRDIIAQDQKEAITTWLFESGISSKEE